MALIVEPGTGLSTAESYVSVDDADTRHTALGNTAWTGAESVKESALRRASQYMLQTYRTRWQGIRINSTQALDWPRSWVVVDGYSIASDSVPADIANACADLALRALSDDLAEDLTRGIVREKVGPLETEFDRNSPEVTRYRAVDMLLAPYLTGGGANVPLTRT